MLTAPATLSSPKQKQSNNSTSSNNSNLIRETTSSLSLQPSFVSYKPLRSIGIAFDQLTRSPLSYLYKPTLCELVFEWRTNHPFKSHPWRSEPKFLERSYSLKNMWAFIHTAPPSIDPLRSPPPSAFTLMSNFISMGLLILVVGICTDIWTLDFLCSALFARNSGHLTLLRILMKPKDIETMECALEDIF